MCLATTQNPELLGRDSSVTQKISPELEAEFTGLVVRQSRFLFRIAYAILRNAQDAEDVIQEVFVKLYRTAAWKTMQDEKAFLARSTWRMANDRRRIAIRTRSSETEIAAEPDNPETRAIRADWMELVHKFIDALPEDLRQPLALSTVQELTSKEISVLMGIPEGTVRSRLNRARQILKRKIESILGVHNAK